MLWQRVLTAVLGLPVVLWCLTSGPEWANVGILTACVALGTYEMAQMILPRLDASFSEEARLQNLIRVPVEPVRLWYCVLMAVCLFLLSAIYDPKAGREILLGGVLLPILVGAFAGATPENAMARILGYSLSISYGLLPWIAAWDLYLFGPGARYLIFLMAIVWSGDTAAYFGGRFFGKRPLAPRMSPKKTWEGAIAGIIGSLIGGLLTNIYYGNALASTSLVILCSLVGGVMGQLGDLVESTFKRYAGIKDSGVIFPGHGGFLDRSDGLLFAAPLIWFILYSLA